MKNCIYKEDTKNNDVAEDKARNEGPRRNANKMESQHIKIEVIKRWIA